jgi:hypothetical protein
MELGICDKFGCSDKKIIDFTTAFQTNEGKIIWHGYCSNKCLLLDKEK